MYSYLCDLVEGNHAAVLGPNNAHLPRVIAVIAEAFARSAVAAGDPTGVRLLNLVRQIQVRAERSGWVTEFQVRCGDVEMGCDVMGRWVEIRWVVLSVA